MQAQISLEAIYARAYGRAIEPYPFQRALAVEPDIEVVIAPTGLGKTAGVTLGWVYRLVNTPQQTPHKLVWCLPMRTLVEQIAGEVAGWISRLQGIFVQVGQPLPTVHILMGGATSEDWRLHPEQAAVVVGTQDMLLSRALMRGYGMSRFGWPIDFGLLHADALWVFDEVQLM
ncbi:MAG TPA: DEAD/DEAH box helicase, partial [Stellaceae bacterium]|nr:DEAD/DEAH box helicase [Stellaceae bacterium]